MCDDFVPFLSFQNIISYFALPEDVASLDWDQREDLCLIYTQQKTETSSCPFGF